MKAICILSFGFFLVETIMHILIHGFMRGKEAYLRRDSMNAFNLALLLIELLSLTPLSENATFHSISKVRALRILFLVQLLYERFPEMKLIFQAFMKSVPFLFGLLSGILFFFTWIAIVMVKLYKDDGYYCDNASAAVRTREECF